LKARQPAKVAVIGFGSFGRLHAATLERLSEACLVAIVEPDPVALRLARELYPTVPAYDDLNAALTKVTADGWVIASPSSSHIPIAQQVLAAGSGVLIEKPLATQLAEAESLLPWVKRNPSRVMLGHTCLFGTEFLQLVDEVQRRSDLRWIQAVRHRPQATLTSYPGETPLHLTMVHDLYCLQVLVHGEEPTHFAAQAGRNADGQVTLVSAQLRWSDKRLACLTASFLTPPGMPGDGFDRLEVFGEGWAARLEPNPRPLAVWDDRACFPLTLEIAAGQHRVSGMLAEELRCFCRVLQGQQAVPEGARFVDGLQLMRWMELLASSWNTPED
jgi:predicted dehydrogenase